jgi:hypothetical protein
MNPVKIFAREDANNYIDEDKGLIYVNDIFRKIEVKNIINTFIEQDELFDTLISTASMLLNIDKNNLVMFDGEYGYGYRRTSIGWYLHAILIKSILRYVERTIIIKSLIAREIYMVRMIGFDTVKQCTLLQIVDKIKCQDRPKFKCAGILDKNDMFNDDILIHTCTIQIITQTLITLMPQCLCDIIMSYVYK